MILVPSGSISHVAAAVFLMLKVLLSLIEAEMGTVTTVSYVSY